MGFNSGFKGLTSDVLPSNLVAFYRRSEELDAFIFGEKEDGGISLLRILEFVYTRLHRKRKMPKKVWSDVFSI